MRNLIIQKYPLPLRGVKLNEPFQVEVPVGASILWAHCDSYGAPCVWACSVVSEYRTPGSGGNRLLSTPETEKRWFAVMMTNISFPITKKPPVHVGSYLMPAPDLVVHLFEWFPDE